MSLGVAHGYGAALGVFLSLGDTQGFTHYLGTHFRPVGVDRQVLVQVKRHLDLPLLRVLHQDWQFFLKLQPMALAEVPDNRRIRIFKGTLEKVHGEQSLTKSLVWTAGHSAPREQFGPG